MSRTDQINLARRRALVLLTALVAALAVSACGGSDGDETSTSDGLAPTSPQAIRIGAKNFTEQAILGELYRQALEAKGFEVALKADIGSSEIIHRALRRGALDMYPEYVGVLLSEVAEVRRRPKDAAASYAVAKAYEKRAGFTLLAQTPFSNSNALGVKPAFAKRHGLRTIADLRRLKGTVKIAALPEFRTRYEGLEGLRDVYNLRNLRVRTVTSEARYGALASGDVDVALIFTTDGQLADEKYVILRDPRGLFAPGHLAPIVSDRTLQAHGPRLRAAVDAVSELLTTGAVRNMNAAVVLRGRTPADVAGEFLRARKLR
jgi:osmoprotectant transport system substrate-binding protein